MIIEPSPSEPLSQIVIFTSSSVPIPVSDPSVVNIAKNHLPLEPKNGQILFASLEPESRTDLASAFSIDSYETPEIRLPSGSWKSLNNLDFGEDALRSIEIENAGGRSALSEMLSIEYFSKKHGATDFLFEMEVEYWISYKMVDFVCSIPSASSASSLPTSDEHPNEKERVGVSVTRAMAYPSPDLFTLEMAKTLLNKKMSGLVIARNAVIKKHRFFTSYLHVWCQTRKIADLVAEAYFLLPESEKSSMRVVLTVYENPEIYHLDFGADRIFPKRS